MSSIVSVGVRGAQWSLALWLGGWCGAQAWSSGSDGSDGALNITSGVVFLRQGQYATLDPDRDNVYHFTTINIAAGAAVRFQAVDYGGEGKPVYLLAQGDVTIAGTITLNGDLGHSSSALAVPAGAGAGGYSGGRGARPGQVATSGNGPGGSAAQLAIGGGVIAPTASHASVGVGDPNLVGRVYGNRFLLPLLGGSGAGGNTNAGTNGWGGGGGGGAILIASSSRITIGQFSGSGIQAIGGRGDNGAGSGSSSGSGGAIRLIAPDLVINNGVLNALAGFGNQGGDGWIRLESFRRTLINGPDIRPSPWFGAPGLVFPPPSAPLLTATTVGGITLPASPTGSYEVPDAVISTGQPVTIAIAATNVPVGTVVEVTLQSEGLSAITVQSTPLAGTATASTATATATFPTGYTRFFLRANW
jgi:hypothetical protein